MANGHISDAFADALIWAIFTHDFTVLPDEYWVGLTLELPTDEEGTGLVIPEAPEYGRVLIPANGASWLSMGVDSRSISSNIDVIFEEASEDWGEINGYTLYDSEVDGVYLGYGITNPYTVLAGMTAQLPAEMIVISLPF